jgi:hypothetical protein
MESLSYLYWNDIFLHSGFLRINKPCQHFFSEKYTIYWSNIFSQKNILFTEVTFFLRKIYYYWSNIFFSEKYTITEVI